MLETTRLLLFAVATMLVTAAASPLRAQATDSTTETLGGFGDWNAFAYREKGNSVCFMAGEPEKKEGKYTRRGEVFAMVTHRPGEETRNVVSLYAGYTFKEGSKATISIDGNALKFFTSGDAAWARNPKDDRTVVRRMIKGRRMVIKGTSSRGTLTTDTYSLKGFTAAYRAISKACKVKPLA
jgi:hypothetical protein